MDLNEIIIDSTQILNIKKNNKKITIKLNALVKEYLGLYTLPTSTKDLKNIKEKNELIERIINILKITESETKENYSLYWDIESQEFLYE
jgi:hypothetical protein